jgi:prepilin-type N-terminal cleavage/methylation domain-containing protein
MKKNNNRGFSLVEIVVTLAIMAVLTGTVSYGLSLSSGKKAEECARKLASELQSMRTLSLGKYEVIGKLYYDSGSDSYILEQTVRKDAKDAGTVTKIVVGVGAVDVSYSNEYSSEGNTYISLKGSDDKSENYICFKFSRSTGALDLNEEKTYGHIRVEKSQKVKYVDIVPLTGRISVADTAPTNTITIPASAETEKKEPDSTISDEKELEGTE